MSGGTLPHTQTFWFKWRSWTCGSSSAEADFQKCLQLAVLFLGWRWDLLCWTAFRKLQKQAEVCWVWQTTWEPQETSWESWRRLLSRPGTNQAAWWRLVFCGNFSGCGRSLPHQMSQIQHLLKWKDPPTAPWCSPTLKHKEGDTSISTVTFLLDKFNYIYDIFHNSKGINNIILTNNTIRNKRPKLAHKKRNKIEKKLRQIVKIIDLQPRQCELADCLLSQIQGIDKERNTNLKSWLWQLDILDIGSTSIRN